MRVAYIWKLHNSDGNCVITEIEDICLIIFEGFERVKGLESPKGFLLEPFGPLKTHNTLKNVQIL